MKNISILLGIVLASSFVITSCKKEVHIHYQAPENSQTQLLQKPKVSYKTGMFFDANSGQRSFSIEFLSETETIQELTFDGEWEFSLPNGRTNLQINERNFNWKSDGRKLTGTAKIDLSNYLSQPDIKHQIKKLRYRLCINGQWWEYEN